MFPWDGLDEVLSNHTIFLKLYTAVMDLENGILGEMIGFKETEWEKKAIIISRLKCCERSIQIADVESKPLVSSETI